MQAVILAAGRGSRLKEGIPKCLLKLDRRPLIEHQIRTLRSLGVNDICVVVGYGAEQVRALLKDTVHYVHNPRALETNSLYSLSLARGWVRGEFLQINADVIADSSVYERLLETKGSALAFDGSSGQSDEHMKVRLRGKRLVEISKSLDPASSDGESLGVLKFDDSGRAMLFKAASQLIADNGENRWAPAAVDRIARHHPIQCVDVAGIAWTEVDFIEDALFAKYEILPSIRSRHLKARTIGKHRGALGIASQMFSAFGNVGGLFGDLF